MGDAVTALSLILAIVLPAASSATPAPEPSPSAAPLKEIIRVRVTTPLCRTLLTEAGDAVAIETANDERLGGTIGAMRKLDFDSNVIIKARSMRDLTRRYVELRAAAVQGLALVKQFRADAKDAATPEQRQALTTFADALAGSLYRQKVLADDAGRLIAYLDTHDPVDAETHDKAVFDAQLSKNSANESAFRNFHHTGSDREIPPTLSEVARDGADELEIRAAPIPGDEDTAATRIDAAFAGC